MENNITSNPYIARMSNQRLEMRSLSPSHSRQLSDYREGQDMIRSAESNIHSYQTNAKVIKSKIARENFPVHHCSYF